MAEPQIVHEFKQVLERISAAPRTTPAGDKRLLVLGVFLANTEFVREQPQVDQLNARASEFIERGFIVRCGWRLREVRDERGTSWSLDRMP